MFRLIQFSIGKRKIQSIATILSVAVSIGMLFALFLIYSGINTGLDISEKRLGADLLVVPSDVPDFMDDSELLFSGAPINVYMKSNIVREIAQIPGVRSVSEQFFAQTIRDSCCVTGTETRIIGFDPEKDDMLQSWTAGGQKIELTGNQIIVGYELFNKGGFNAEEVLVLGHTMQVKGVLDPTGTSLGYSILMHIDTARSLMLGMEGYHHFWERLGPPEQLVSAVLVSVEEGRQEEVMRAIRKLDDVAVIQSSDTLGEIHDQMHIIYQIMLVAGILAGLASIMQLFARFYSMVWDRKGEWGLYRALGASRRDLSMLITAEALVFCLCGAIAGLLVGGGLYFMILNSMRSQGFFPFIAPPLLLIGAGAAAIIFFYLIISMLAAMIPAVQSGKIDPSAAMALGDID